MKEREQIKWQGVFFSSFPMRYELTALFKLENWWHDYTPRLPEKYLTGLSWIPLCQTGFYIVLISYEQWGETEAYAFHRTASGFSFFVLSLSSCLSHHLTSVSPRCVFWIKRCIIINFSLFFPLQDWGAWPLALTKSVNLPWKLHRKGSANYWRALVKASELGEEK